MLAKAAAHPLPQSAGYAITSDLASVVGSPSRMASGYISNVSRDAADLDEVNIEITFMRAILILFSMLLSSCGGATGPLSLYKMDIRQGNFVTAEMREKLKLGMSRQQVRYVLGTPMISDPFHANRWDYVYLLEHRGKLIEEKRLTLYFDGDNLAGIDDGSKPAEAAPAIKPDASVPGPAGG